MTKPVPPTPPLPALRSDPDTFSVRAEGTITYLFNTFPDYAVDVVDFCDTAANALLTGNLPPLTGQAGRYLRVNGTADGVALDATLAAIVSPVTAAGAALLDDTDAAAQRTTLGLGTAATTDLIDEDDMASDSATAAPSQQSVKAYVDGRAGGRLLFILHDQKPQSTDPQIVVSANTWITRDLNTEVADPEGVVTLSSNQFTVTVDCDVWWQVPGFQTRHQSRLWNVTDGVVAGLGVSMENSGVSLSNGAAICAAGKTYRVEQNFDGTGQETGDAANRGTEVYTMVFGRSR